MTVLLVTFILFSAAFIIHFIIWRVRIPRYQTNTFLWIFFCVFAAGIVVFKDLLFGSQSLDAACLSIAQVCLLYVSFVVGYMVSYPAACADSPTLLILLKISEAKPYGLKKEDIESILTNNLLVNPRIQDLLDDKMIYREGDKYRLTKKGRNFIRVFVAYRKLLNIPLRG